MQHKPKVIQALMPLGVEHCGGAGFSSMLETVIQALMPLGVEHKTLMRTAADLRN